MKKLLLSITAIFSVFAAIACPVCERQQPGVLQGIAHGGGPQSNWDYIIILTAVIIVLMTLFYSIKWLIHPGEQSASHIKYLILNNE